MTEHVEPAAERIVPANGVGLCAQAFGAPGSPTILLIGGAEASMDWWEDAFCGQLASAGRYVIRYDSRDTGRSTTFPVGAPPYNGEDMLADAIGLLDAFDLSTAHIVGMSGGGMLAQALAVRHPARVTTLTLISTTPGGPGLPPMSAGLAARFQEPSPGPDWSDRESVIAYFIEGEHGFAGTIPVDEPRIRRIACRAFDRSPNPAAATNHWMIEGGEPIRPCLGEVTAPTLVLHGTDDPLFPYGHAEALAREIPDAKLIPLLGVGHQVPPPEVWDTAIPAIVDHTA